jgi:hypothetical protein
MGRRTKLWLRPARPAISEDFPQPLRMEFAGGFRISQRTVYDVPLHLRIAY